MTTREEVEAVGKRYAAWIDNDMPTPVRMRYERDRHILVDRHILADAFLAERAERQRRIEAAATEIWRKIPKEFAHFERGQVGQLIAIITRHLEETT